MTDKPWYRKGLQFQCTECGDCCTGAPGYVWVNREEIENLASLIGMDPTVFEARYVRRVGIRNSLAELPGGDCVFFDPQSRTCRVYAARPRQCRTWPFWNSNLRTPEAWAATCQACPGCGEGTLYPLDQIEQLRGTIHV